LHFTSRVRRASGVVAGAGGCAAVVALAAGTAHAFNSYPTGAPHDQITKAAETAESWPYAKVAVFQEAVRQPDWDETQRKKWLTYVPNANYRSSHHFDRAAGVTHKNAFIAGATYLREQKQLAIDKASAADSTAATAAAGRALHALQDFFSHSNFVDLCDDDKAKTLRALYDGSVEPPAKLQLTGYDKDAEDPEKPTGDTFSHGDFSKDTAAKNAEAKAKIGDDTKYKLSFDAAVQNSSALIQAIKAAVSSKPRRAANHGGGRIDPIRPASGPYDSLYAAHCEFPCGPAGCVLVCDDTMLEVPPGSLASSDLLTLRTARSRFFFTADQTFAWEGGWTLVWRELLSATSPYFSPPLLATVTFPDSALDETDLGAAGVYFFDPDSLAYLRVPGAVVEPESARARFPVAKPGSYAVGAPRPAEDMRGACCLFDSTCTQLTLADCNAQGGVFFGPKFPCTPDPCHEPPSGACCIADSCVRLRAVTCAARCGTYLGDGRPCEGRPCGTVDVALTDVTVALEGAAVRITWTLARDVDPSVVQILRAAGGDVPVVLAAVPVSLDRRDGFLDTTVIPERTYRYWLDVADGHADSRRLGPWTIHVTNPQAAALLNSGPNPAAERSRIQFYVPRQTDVELVVYTTSGRALRTVVARRFDAGTHDLVWDHRDALGQPAPAGVYAYRLRAGGAVFSGKFVVIR